MKIHRHHEVVMYSSPSSKMCELSRQYLRDQGIDFLDKNIAVDEIARKKMIEISEQTDTPVVEIDGRVVIGFRPDVYNLILSQSEDRYSRPDEDEEKKKMKWRTRSRSEKAASAAGQKD